MLTNIFIINLDKAKRKGKNDEEEEEIIKSLRTYYLSKFIIEIFSKTRLFNIIEMINILNDATYVFIVDDDNS